MNAVLRSIGYNAWVLPALLLVPVLGAAIIWALGALRRCRRPDTPPTGDDVISGAVALPRMIALVTFVVELVISLGLWWSFEPANAGWQALYDTAWIPSWGIRFTVGVDGIAVMMVLLTTCI